MFTRTRHLKNQRWILLSAPRRTIIRCFPQLVPFRLQHSDRRRTVYEYPEPCKSARVYEVCRGERRAAALAACAAPGAAPAPAAGEAAAPAAAGGGQLEIFSWWTAGGEVEALNALFEIYKRDYPDVEIVNAALAGGAGQGGKMKALLETRMQGGQPPDSFQVHLGHELIDSHVIAGRMEPLDYLYAEEGYDDVFPEDLIDIASYDGHPWSVPVNIHRSNVHVVSHRSN